VPHLLASAMALLWISPQGPGTSDRERPRLWIEARTAIRALSQALVKVSLANPGPRKLALKGIPSVHLRPVAAAGSESASAPSAFWAPFDPATGSSLALHSSPSLILAPGETRTLTLRLGDLNWGTEFQARWPEHPMTILPKGRYRLVVEISGQDLVGAPLTLRSNEPEVLLWGEEPAPQP